MNINTYNWDKPLLPGTVICSNYNSFEGDKKVGLFVVLYDEQSDNSIIDDKNIIALKISTKGTCVSNYSVELSRNLNNFLDSDCIACCSKIHTLHKKDQVYKVLGGLHPATYHKVFKVYSKFNANLQDQLISFL